MLAIWKYARRGRKRISSDDQKPNPYKNNNIPPTQTTRRAPRSELSSITVGNTESFDPSVKRVSIEQIVQKTKNFSPGLVIGHGSFGTVYRAKLSSGKSLAIKTLKSSEWYTRGCREFRAEVEALGNLSHPNIVQILGYCAEGRHRILVYEFIERGSLDRWLYDTTLIGVGYDPEMTQRVPLSWSTRVNIIRGVAKGLAYLHSLDTPIIHREIEASNVLLDAKFEAHLTDFGLARMIEGSNTHVSTQARGTRGYMPPEYAYVGQGSATMKGDVYSFGILMMETVTGKKPIFPVSDDHRKEVLLVEWVNEMMQKKKYMELVDANISREYLQESAVMEYFKIAATCACEVYKNRPPMDAAVRMLSKVPT